MIIKYYYKDGHVETFDKYYVINDIIRNKKTDEEISQQLTKSGYKRVTLRGDDRKRKSLLVHRLLASTYIGPPPTLEYTVDHKDRNRTNNSLENLSWKNSKDQAMNREYPESFKSAFIVVKDEIEKTIQDWVIHLQNENTPFGNAYTYAIIAKYAQQKRFGFVYKVFDDLPGERWKNISESKTSKGHWEISNKKRVKYVTKHASNVLDVSQLYTQDGYPSIQVNGKKRLIHILCLQAFYPEKYASIKPGEKVLHKEDDRHDFRPENLRLGTSSENGKDAHDNGKYDGTKSARKSYISFINDIKEKDHDSLHAAIRFLQENGYPKAICSNIRGALGTCKIRYDRTWKLVHI